MTISIKPTASGSTIEQDGSTVLSVESDRSVDIDSGTLHVDATNNRVGIGTSSPTISSGNGVHINAATAGPSVLHMTTGNQGTTSSDGLDIKFGAGDVSFWNYETGVMTFATSNTERMRIDSNGNLLVGTTSGFDGGNGITFKSPTNHFITTWRTTTSTGNYIHGFVSDVGGVGTAKYAIYANGTAGAISDENYKKNIELARDYLSDINQINIIKYNWKTDKEDANKEIGFSAQQVETIFPTMVDTVTASLEDGSEITHKMLKKDVFLPMAIKCIQELSAKIEALEARVATLEGN